MNAQELVDLLDRLDKVISNACMELSLEEQGKLLDEIQLARAMVRANGLG